MWTFYHFLGELLHNPVDRSDGLDCRDGWDRWMPWVVGTVGMVIAGIMAYAWWTAPKF